MNKIFHYCQGESHKSTDKACQDYAYAESSDSLSIAIVCDGHGGERYFRSQYGSQFAVEITKDAIKEFVELTPKSTLNTSDKSSVFDGAPFTSFVETTANEAQLESKAHQSLKQLLSSIISQWNNRIAKDALGRDLTEWEETYVEQKYKDEFLAKRKDETATFEKTYGCTLMAYVQTPRYWFAFHIGDGKCIMMQNENGNLVCSQPIPWDERCFLNKTTSLCDTNALEEFRYCYQGDGTFPLAVFLGSDGMDDSYGDGENLDNFYIELYKIILKKGYDKALLELKKYLPEISRVGSKDDMSVASIYNNDNIKDTFILLTDYQMDKLKCQKEETEKKIQALNSKKEQFGEVDILSNAEKINYNYTCEDIKKLESKMGRINKKFPGLRREITKFKNRFND